MHEKFITLETAKQAKTKGFGDFAGDKTWYCHGKYFHKKPSGYNIDWKEDEVLYITGYDNLIVDYLNQKLFSYAPTQSTLQKWLREDKLIQVEAHYNDMYKWYQGVIYDLRTNQCLGDIYADKSETFEECLELTIQEALKLI